MALDLKQLLTDSGALLEGHFLLTSGRHSDRYIEKFRLLERPAYIYALHQAMAPCVPKHPELGSTQT